MLHPVADFTASGESHPALKTKYTVVLLVLVYDRMIQKAIPNFLFGKLYKNKQMFYTKDKSYVIGKEAAL